MRKKRKREEDDKIKEEKLAYFIGLGGNLNNLVPEEQRIFIQNEQSKKHYAQINIKNKTLDEIEALAALK